MNEDERLFVCKQVMACLETDFPEVAKLFQVYPDYPQPVFGAQDALPGPDAFAWTGNRLIVLPDPSARLEGEIRDDERRKICAREGHSWADTTSFGSSDIELRCTRCGAHQTEPRT